MRGARGRLRLPTLVQCGFHRWVAPALLLFSLRRWHAATVGASSIIGITLAQDNLSGGTNGDGSSGGAVFFPLSEALASIMRLAVDDVNARSAASLREGNLTLSVFGVNTGTSVMESLCNALEIIGEKGGTFGVSVRCLFIQLFTVVNTGTNQYTEPASVLIPYSSVKRI